MKTTAIDVLTELLRSHGKIPTIWDSSDQAGRARGFSYWGGAHYELRLNKRGQPANYALEAVRSDCCNPDLAWRDAGVIAKLEHRVFCSTTGRLTEVDATHVLENLSLAYPTMAALAAEKLRKVPDWTQRSLHHCGLCPWFALARSALTQTEHNAVRNTAMRVERLRTERRRRKHVKEPTVREWRSVIRHHGFELERLISRGPTREIEKRYKLAGHPFGGTTRNDAIRCWLSMQPRRLGEHMIYRSSQVSGKRRSLGIYFEPAGPLLPGEPPEWPGTLQGMRWLPTRDRRALAAAIRKDRDERQAKQACAAPDPKAPDTLGWRVWLWDYALERLRSPHRRTVWETPELRVEKWDNREAVRGLAGIHAARMPYDWKRADISRHNELCKYVPPRHGQPPIIVGMVERFGKYVLGTEGWRAEIAVIRALRAPTTEIGLALEKAYPDVEVYYEDR